MRSIGLNHPTKIQSTNDKATCVWWGEGEEEKVSGRSMMRSLLFAGRATA